ncbi:MAG: class I SAM-dependent methyltransferase [Chitinophagaceae bacterium]|nr:class I SAM-dependent methyltransferase [Chitinophagaceae bacterium]
MNSYFVKREVCPACRSNSFKKRFSVKFDDPGIRTFLDNLYNPQGGVEYEYLEGAEYSLVECNNCKLVFQEYIGNDELMMLIYEKWIDPEMVKKNSVTAYTVDYYKKYSAEIINIIAYLNKLPSDLKFFDFGMGWGKWCLMAKAFGVEAFGAELSPERIAYARSNGIKVLEWKEFPDYQFDFINTEQVFEHIPEPLNTMKYLSKSLKPGGIIKISVPNGNGIERILKSVNWTAKRKALDSLMVVSPLEHINCYRTESVLKMGELCGLENVKPSKDYIGFRSLKDLAKTSLRAPYYKYFKTGDFAYYFRKPA